MLKYACALFWVKKVKDEHYRNLYFYINSMGSYAF